MLLSPVDTRNAFSTAKIIDSFSRLSENVSLSPYVDRHFVCNVTIVNNSNFCWHYRVATVDSYSLRAHESCQANRKVLYGTRACSCRDVWPSSPCRSFELSEPQPGSTVVLLLGNFLLQWKTQCYRWWEISWFPVEFRIDVSVFPVYRSKVWRKPQAAARFLF